MSDKVKPWQRQRVSNPMRRSGRAGRDDVRAAADVAIPTPHVHMNNPVRSCYRKRPYADEQVAVRLAHRQSESSGIPIRAYPCPHCGQWHIGSHDTL